MSAAEATGYRSRSYVDSLRHLGEPRPLVACGGWLLTSLVPGSTARDGRAPYPLFLCDRWGGLPHDLESLEDLVSATMVVDPLAPVSPADLSTTFDVVRPFKTHYLHDTGGGSAALPRHHVRKLRTASRRLSVEVLADPASRCADWVRLYGNLVARHAITGFADMPERSLRAQLTVPGCEAVIALSDDRCVSMAVWYRHGDAAHLHLAASDDVGYASGAAYAVMAASLEHLGPAVRVVDLGGVAGEVDDLSNGLARFKAGWSTRTSVAHLCGAVLDRERFDDLSATQQASGARYFPPYRALPA